MKHIASLVFLIAVLLTGIPFKGMHTISHAEPHFDGDVKRFDIEDSMEPGKTYRGRVTVKNMGTEVWKGHSGFEIVCKNTMSPSGAGVQRDEFRFDVAINEDVRPGQEKTFYGELEAPSWAGEWRLTCSLVRNNKAFGRSLSKTVTVVATGAALDAEISHIQLESEMTAGKTYTVTVTVKNTGTCDWSETTCAVHLVCLVKATESGSESDGEKKFKKDFPLRDPVMAGRANNYSYSVRAPRTPGTWVLQWQMIKEGGAHFGRDAALTVTVK